jgi:hypothetical protein
MNKPKFTREQEDWICYQIGEWYLEWKEKITPNMGAHKLGVAKEKLKQKLFGDFDVCFECGKKFQDGYWDMTKNIRNGCLCEGCYKKLEMKND